MARRKTQAPTEKKIRLSLSSSDAFLVYVALRYLRRIYLKTLADIDRHPAFAPNLDRGQIDRDLLKATATAQTFADALDEVFDPEAII